MGLKGKINKMYYRLTTQDKIDIAALSSLEYITPQMFGAVGDGEHNDTYAVQLASQSLKDNQTLYFPNGIYRFVPERSSNPNSWAQNSLTAFIQLKNRQNITVDLGGSTIFVESNSLYGYHVIDVMNCINFTIKNGTIIGDRKTHDYTAGSTHELGYGIHIWTPFPTGDGTSGTEFPYQTASECSGTVKDINCYDMTGDSLVTKNGAGTGKILVKDCEFHHNRRQGISVLDSDEVILENLKIHHIGTYDGITGTAPMSGIDIEPNTGIGRVVKVTISCCKIYQVDGFALIGGPRRDEIGTAVEALIDEISLKSCEILGDIQFYTKKTDDIVNLILETTNKEATVLGGGFSESFNMANCLLKFNGHELIESPIAIISNSTIIGNPDKKSTVRIKTANCFFSNITIKSVGQEKHEFGGGNNSTYENCDFAFYNQTDNPFVNCSLMNCNLINEAGYNSLLGPTAYLYNCTLDTRLFKFGNYVSCTILDELES